jgi:hypothetical protein
MAAFSVPRPSKIYPNNDFFGMKIKHLATLMEAALTALTAVGYKFFSAFRT